MAVAYAAVIVYISQHGLWDYAEMDLDRQKFDIDKASILITGASGSLGKQLLYEFHRRGLKPIAHVRPSSDTGYIDSLQLEKRSADLRQKEQLAALVDGVDLVIHTAAWVNFRKDRLTQFTGINTIGALDLFRAAQAAGVKRFVHVSTVAAVAASRRINNGRLGSVATHIEPLNEESPFNLDHLSIPYIMTKHAAEIELEKAAAEGNTELITVNPSIIIAPSRTGDDRRKASKMFSRHILPDLRNRINLVDIRDVVPGIISAAERGRSGQRYILAGDDITVRDLLLSVSGILGKMPHLVRLPRPFLMWLARFSVFYCRVAGVGKVSFYPDLVRLLDYDWSFSSMKARRELGYTNRSVHVSLDNLLTNRFSGTHMKP